MLEVHSVEELQSSNLNYIDLIGVNNRNLQTFNVDIQISKELASHIPDEFVKVTESGISSPTIVIELQSYGYEGFLIGEAFMRNSRTEEACANFISQVEKLKKSALV